MDSLHSHFGLIAPGPAKLTLAASQYRTRFCIDKKFGNSTLGQPPTTISGHSGYFRWLALDGNLAWPRERWATILTCVDEGSAIRCHLLVAQLAQYGSRQDALNEEILFQHHHLAVVATKSLEGRIAHLQEDPPRLWAERSPPC